MSNRIIKYICIFSISILVMPCSLSANDGAVLVSGDASITVKAVEGGLYKLNFSYQGTPIPTINPDATIFLELAGSKVLSGNYSSCVLNSNMLTCQALLTTSLGTNFNVSDIYIAKGNGIIELQRKIRLSNSKAGDRFFNSFFGFRTDEQATDLTRNEYFIPAVWYKGNFTVTGNIPEYIPQVNDTYFYYREDRITLPLVMFRNPRTNFTLSIIHKDSKCETVIADGNGIDTDAGYQFGSLGIKRENKVIYTNFIYPGSEAERRGGRGPRYHPIQDDLVHEYNLELCFSSVNDYATAVKDSWGHAFELYNPTIYPVDLDVTYNGIIETLMHYYGEDTSMGGKYDAAGWPFEVDLTTFEPRNYDYQMGFVGMQVATGYYIYREGVETGNNDMIKKGEAVLNFWASKSQTSLGLPRDWYDPGWWGKTGAFRDGSNLRVNTGGMESLIAAWAFAKRSGIEKPEWLDACKRYGDWLIDNQNRDGSYYFSYNHKVINAQGKHPVTDSNKFLTICAVRYLAELHIAAQADSPGDNKYREAAEKAGDFCYRNIHNTYTYVSCVIDNPRTYDSESGQMALNGFLALYDLTKDAKWLTAAEQAATYTESWVHCMEIPVENDKGNRPTKFPRDRSIVGQHIIAIGHAGADLGFAWSSFAFYRLYLETGNEHYLKVARISAHNSKQSMNWDQSLFPGQQRGLQMEVFNVSGRRRENGAFTCLNWNYAAHLDPMFRFKDAFGTPNMEEVEKMSWENRKYYNDIYSHVQSANWGQDIEKLQ